MDQVAVGVRDLNGHRAVGWPVGDDVPAVLQALGDHEHAVALDQAGGLAGEADALRAAIDEVLLAVGEHDPRAVLGLAERV